jgi:hypothetical protein
LDIKDSKAKTSMLQAYGATDFSDIVIRNLERIYIQKEAVLKSVASEVFQSQSINGLHTLINQAPAGGVKVQYPVDQGNMGDHEADNLPDMGAQYLNLDRANVTYHISHEAVFEGGNLAQNDSILEATEQLAAKIDKVLITDLAAKKFSSNSFTAAAKWDAAGSPYDDIRKATNNIIKNSAINTLAVEGNPKFFSCIVPIALREVFQKREVVDGVKTTLAGQIESNLNTRILYSRAPFTGEGDSWPISTTALIIPTMDRKVGRLYSFDGGNVIPSLFQTVNENGKRVSQNSWWKVGIAANEKDATFSDNRRIAEIDTIV